MRGKKGGARTVSSELPGVRNGTEKFPSASVLRSRCSRVASLSMTTAARATGVRLGSLTLPAIAPVLAVWACISRGQNAKTEILNKMQVACIEMLHITPLVQQWSGRFGALSLLQVVVNHAAMTSIGLDDRDGPRVGPRLFPFPIFILAGGVDSTSRF